MAQQRGGRGRGRRRVRKNIPFGQAHIKTSFNNTIVALTDREGNVIAWESAGGAGFKGSRKSTPFAAQVTADSAARKGMEQGLEKVEVFVKGPGSGRETAVTCAANGGDLRDPLKPAPPADSQAMTFPSRSVRATIVLLKLVLMWAWPNGMFLRTRRRPRPLPPFC